MSAARHRGRRVLRILMMLVIAGGLGLAAAWSWGTFSVAYDFRKESRAVLRSLTSGEDAAKEAYNDASFLLREASLPTTFVDRVDQLTQVLGQFEEIEKVKEVEMLDSIRGKTARIRYIVRFRNEKTSESVTTEVELSYLLRVRENETKAVWRLLGFNISVPATLESRLKMIKSEYDRIKAPAEVVKLVDQTLLAIAAGQGAAVREQASDPFQDSTTAESFANTLERYQKELGAFQRRLTIHSSGQNAEMDRARVHVLLQFEKAKTSASFEFIKRDGVWRLLHLKILIPEPFFPTKKS